MATTNLILPDRALSITQGYAWATVAGWKPIENRTWSTKFRGPLAIHASSTGRSLFESEDIIRAACPDVDDVVDALTLDDAHWLWHLSVLVGVVEVADCIEYDPRSATDRKRLLARCRELRVKSISKAGDKAILAFAQGPWCWLVRNAIEFSTPIYALGRTSLWSLTPQQQQAIGAALKIAAKRKGPAKPCPPVWIHPQSEIARAKRNAVAAGR